MIRLQTLFGEPGEWARAAVWTVAASLFFALIGPFGGYERPFEWRLAYCLSVGASGALVYVPLLLAGRAYGRRLGFPEFWAVIVAALAAALPASLVVALVDGLFSGPTDTPPPVFYINVVSIVLPLTLLVVWRRRREAAAPAQPKDAAPPRLLARLPAGSGRTIFALEAEDHYVRVHTETGSTLVLMRLADAAAEMDGAAGVHVHRSWWVAAEAVEHAERSGRAANLVLKNGVMAPVARTAMPAARAAGMLKS